MWALMLAAGIAPLAIDVETVEVNTFGSPDYARTALIYRDAKNQIIDWRWAAKPGVDKTTVWGEQAPIPQQVALGQYLTAWNDRGRLIVLRCRRVVYTRTEDDRELSERKKLPETKRRKLLP